MDSMMSGDMSSDDSSGPLTTQGVDLFNATQAGDFLDDLLDDSTLQVTSNAYARYFWYGVVVVIGIATIVNVFQKVALSVRRRQALKGQLDPARPKNMLMRGAATMTAIGREASYLQFTPLSHPFWVKVPPMGNIILILAYLGFVLALEFVNNNVPGAQYQQALGIRAGWLAVAQLPLLILLIGKNNLIGLATGVSYERLNVFHRWSARIMLLLATFHFGFQGDGWSKFSGIFNLEWTTDSCVPTGLATYVLLIWLNISTYAPIRNLCYEFFVVQHIVTFMGFIIALFFHLPSTAYYSRVYAYIPVALYLVDRLVRTARYAYTNYKASRATLTAMDGATRIQLKNPRIKSWIPGAHVLVSFPKLGFGQNHPATIASTPESHDGDLVLILKSQKGFTRTLLAKASESTTGLIASEETKADSRRHEPSQQTFSALVDGPYGGQHADFAAFDSVCLIAGSTGITFILPILLDIAHRAEKTRGKLPLRRVHIIWCVKELGHAKWVHRELATAFRKLRTWGIESEMSFFVTCADQYTTSGDAKDCPCDCDKSLGPCCCINPEDIEREKEIVGPLLGGDVAKGAEPAKRAADVREMAVESEDTPSPSSTRAVVYSGRPRSMEIIESLLNQAKGETGIAVCGPLGMSTSVRNAVVDLSDRRAVHKGTGAQGVYLHIEGFGV